MLKRTILSVIVLAFVASLCFAQGARQSGEPTYAASMATTTFTNIGVTGYDTAGVPSVITMVGLTGDSTMTYYLWIDEDGDLLIASHTTMKGFTSFPNNTWKSLKDSHTGIGTVGEQT